MARLIPQGQGGLTQPLELRLGTNRLGRGPQNDFSIDHATVSALHCEVVLSGDSLTVRDLDSTNGTYINGQPIRTATLQNGHYLRLGSVELLVEVIDVNVVIPQPRAPALPPVLKTAAGKNVCIHHDFRQAVWKCTRCACLLCTPCIHRLRRRGGKTLYLCPDCSGLCEVLPEFARKPKRSWFGFVSDKLHLTRLITRRLRKPPDW
jgi:pSer/pThr/pTyr-binding forkhead associated (FHA) protein